MGLSRNKVAVPEGAAGSPPFYGDLNKILNMVCLCWGRALTVGRLFAGWCVLVEAYDRVSGVSMLLGSLTATVVSGHSR